MRRREFITIVGSAAASWRLAAHAQQSAMKHVGVLMDIAETDATAKKWVDAFETPFAASGWRKGRDCDITYRWGGSNPELLARHAEELVRLAPDAILAHGTPAMIPLQKKNAHRDTDRVHRRIGPNWTRLRCQYFASGWQHNRIFQFRAGHRRQMAASPEGHRSFGDQCRGDVQPAHVTL
jgi:hypothetical protein